MNARVVENRRGSSFYLCELSKTDPRFRKYPVLPVVQCDGYRREADGDGEDGSQRVEGR